jgi:hypothetical protein
MSFRDIPVQIHHQNRAVFPLAIFSLSVNSARLGANVSFVIGNFLSVLVVKSAVLNRCRRLSLCPRSTDIIGPAWLVGFVPEAEVALASTIC